MITAADKNKLINLSWQLHDVVERGYLADPAGKDEPEWSEKQRLLLADMAVHLFQTALQPGALDSVKLKDNLFAILAIADQYFPHLGLKNTAYELDKNHHVNSEN